MRLPIICSAILLGAGTAGAADPPTVDAPEASGQSHPADAALVVGNEDYAYLSDVPYAARDAQATFDWLVKVRGVPINHAHLFVNASHASLRDGLEAAVADVEQGGILWIYFAGHGAGAVRSDGSTERALVGKSAEADANTLADFVVPVSEIASMAGSSKAGQILVMIDACYANADRSGKTLLAGRFLVPDQAIAAAPRLAVWTGVGQSEVAEAYEPARHGLFTYFLLQALGGQADGALGATDGQVTLDEAAAWTSEAVRVVGDFQQNPVLIADPSISATSLASMARPPSKLDLATLPKARATAGGDALKAELDRLRQEQEAARLAAEHASKSQAMLLAEASQGLLAEASVHWTQVRTLAEDPGEAAEIAVRRFIDTYGTATVLVDGTAMPVEIPEVARAEKLLADLTKQAERAARKAENDRPPADKGASRGGGFPWLLATGGAVALAGGGALVWGGSQESAFMDDLTEGTWEGETATRQGQINHIFIAGYSALGVGVALGSVHFLTLSSSDGVAMATLSGRW